MKASELSIAIRWLSALLIMIFVAACNLAFRPDTSLWQSNNSAFSTSEIILDPPWVKGAATLLADNFESVQVASLNTDGFPGILFDEELAGIYGIETDSTKPAIDLVGQSDLTSVLVKRDLIRYEFESFCRIEESQYCPLALVWSRDNAGGSAQFEVVRLEAARYALIELQLLNRLADEFRLELSKRVAP